MIYEGWSVMDELEQKLKEREALEGAYGTLVEPYVNQHSVIRSDAVENIAVDGMGVFCASAWLVLTVVYCAKVRSHFSNVTR